MDDKFVNGTMLNNFAKKLKSNIKSDLLGDKKLRYLTQAEYDLLTDDEKNDENIIYNITDADIPDYVTQEELNTAIQENGFSGDYNDLENRPCYDDRNIQEIIATTNNYTDTLTEADNTWVKANIDFPFTNIEDLKSSMVSLRMTTQDNTIELSKTDLSAYTIPIVESELYSVSEYYILIALEDINFNEMPLSKGLWLATNLYGMSIESEFTLNISTGTFKELDEKYISYKPGKIVSGQTFTVYTGEYDDNGNKISEDIVAKDGAEIFNSNTNKATGTYSHSEGHLSMAVGDMSHVEGYSTEAYGESSHAEGESTKAYGKSSHAEGYYSEAIGDNSHAEGYYSEAIGDNSHAEGKNTIARGECQHVQGKNNIEDTENKYVHIVGNGIDYTEAGRSNAHTLDWDGNAWFQGNVSIDGTPTNDNDLTTKKYVDEAVAANSGPSVVMLSQAEYDALGNNINPETLYIIG